MESKNYPESKSEQDGKPVLKKYSPPKGVRLHLEADSEGKPNYWTKETYTYYDPTS